MKPHANFFLAAVLSMTAFSVQEISAQQNYKLRQGTSLMGMKSETTIYVKPMRKRTEAGGMMGQPNNLVTIEQCDKQRTVTLNTKKKLYFIEPFQSDDEEVIDEDAKPVAKPKTAPVTAKKGGTIYNYYQVTDTGERKKMYGFTARHVWTYQKMKPSPDACSMKDSMIIKTDGWYIDLPEFNCPVRYKPVAGGYGGADPKPECKDRFVTRRSGKGKLGFPLIEKRTMIMGGQASTSEFVTDLETLELITGKQDSMLFEIPPGYAETKNYNDLQDKFDPMDMMKQYRDDNKNDPNGLPDNVMTGGEKEPGKIRIGVLEPKGEGLTERSGLQQHIVNRLFGEKTEAVAAASEDDARSRKCDYTLSTDLLKMKPGSKVGGLLKAIKNTDPNAASSFNIEASMVLTSLADGSVRSQQNINGKFDGKPDDAAKKATDEGVQKILKDLR